ncbi:MAG: hypothetical protein U5K72_04380 [Balneolaceae bacterium]|nr:hypothetical protein [Balneolaceae bacterium]
MNFAITLMNGLKNLKRMIRHSPFKPYVSPGNSLDLINNSEEPLSKDGFKELDRQNGFNIDKVGGVKRKRVYPVNKII